jgi:hypothetical protein
MPARSTSEINTQIADLVENLKQIDRAIRRKLVVGTDTAPDRTRKVAVEKQIATLHTTIATIDSERSRQTAEQIAALAASYSKGAIELLEDRLMALAPPEKPRSPR